MKDFKRNLMCCIFFMPHSAQSIPLLINSPVPFIPSRTEVFSCTLKNGIIFGFGGQEIVLNVKWRSPINMFLSFLFKHAFPDQYPLVFCLQRLLSYFIF